MVRVVVFGIPEAVILKQEIGQASTCKIRALGTLAAHWVIWNRSLDILIELCLYAMLVALLIILTSLPHVFPGKMKLQHIRLQLCPQWRPQAKTDPGHYFLSHQKRNCDFIPFAASLVSCILYR